MKNDKHDIPAAVDMDGINPIPLSKYLELELFLVS